MPNNTALLVTIDKFDPNLMLVNINKLKPFMFIEDKTLQPVLVKFGDLVINKPIQAKKLVPLLVELENFQLVELEPISNHSTHGSIKITNVFVHHYHNFPFHDNNAMVNNDPCRNPSFRLTTKAKGVVRLRAKRKSGS